MVNVSDVKLSLKKAYNSDMGKIDSNWKADCKL